MLAVAEAIIDPDDGSVYGKVRLLFCLFVMRMCGTDGRPSILAMTREITRHFLQSDGTRLRLEALRPHASTDQAMAAMEVMDALSSGDLYIVVDGLWTAIHHLRVAAMHPEDHDLGGEIATLMSNPTRPLTLFLASNKESRSIATKVNAVAVDMIVRMRAALPHRDRTLQLIIDDAGWFMPCVWTSTTMRMRAPAGTSGLLVFQHLSQHRTTWCGPDLGNRSERADHVLAFQNEVDGYEAGLVDRMLQRGSARTPAPGRHEDGRHIVFDERSDAHRTLRTPYILPPRRPR